MYAMSMRIIRVSQDLKRVMSTVFMRVNLRNAIVRNIQMSKDLRFATIEIVSIDPIYTDEEMVKIVNKKIAIIVKNMRSLLSLKSFPKIRFVVDAHRDRIDEIEKLMKEVREKDEQAGLIPKSNEIIEEIDDLDNEIEATAENE